MSSRILIGSKSVVEPEALGQVRHDIGHAASKVAL